MKIEYLREFAVLAEQLNFTAAAESLYITQPALSNHISTLEKIGGFKLVERGRGNASRLTKTGRAFLTYANKIVNLYDEAIVECQKIEKEAAGTLVVQIPVDMHTGVRCLLDFVRRFSAQHPNVEIIRRSNSSYGLTSSVRAADVDVSMTRSLYAGSYEGYVDDEELGFIPLTHEKTCAWIDSNHPLAERPTISVSDLGSFTYPYMTPFHHVTWLQIFSSIKERYGIELDAYPVLVGIREDFYLGTFKPSDCVLLSESLQNDLMLGFREDRVWKQIEPAIDFAHWLVYNKQSENPARDAFIRFVTEELQLSR